METLCDLAYSDARKKRYVDVKSPESVSSHLYDSIVNAVIVAENKPAYNARRTKRSSIAYEALKQRADPRK
jgi:hypothetical protein